MHPLTDGIPKSLLPVGENYVLDCLLQEILERSNGEVVVVTGYGADKVESHLRTRYGSRVTIARNDRYAEDVNILSVDIGVGALAHPERGYVVVETDMLMDAPAWDQIFDGIDETPHSYWVCKGYYGPELTGGIVHVGDDGCIDTVEYQPKYDASFAGWPKLFGVLIVGPEQVEADKRWRATVLETGCNEYYLTSWARGVHELTARVLQLDPGVARTFNTVAEFEAAQSEYLALKSQAAPKSPEALLQLGVSLVDVDALRSIEGYDEERVSWLVEKIRREGRWTKPLAVDSEHGLVLDGQHRLQAAHRLGLARLPVVHYVYADVEVWSLRPEISLDWEAVVARVLADNPYPYKTVKHRFPGAGPVRVDIPLEELKA